jgi:hypothetical protein
VTGIPPVLLSALKYVVIVAVVFIVGRLIRSTLKPRFGRLEFATSKVEATRTIGEWVDGFMLWRAYAAIIADFPLIATYVWAAWGLMRLSYDQAETLHTVWLHIGFFALTVVAAMANVVENVTLLYALFVQRGTMFLWVTLVTAWTKYSLLSLTLVYVIFNFEAYLLSKVESQVPALVALTLFAALLFARRATQLSRQKPPLLMLQLAPDRVAAKDLLERWGQSGRTLASAALWHDSLFAVLYGLTLAAICKGVTIDGAPRLQTWARNFAWVILIGAACHIAQNIGALVAIRMRTIGWWVTPMRFFGRLRLIILSAGAVFFVALLIRFEYKTALALVGLKSAEDAVSRLLTAW